MITLRELVRLAAVGDIHCHRKSKGMLRPLFAQMSQAADVVLLLGDLTDYGLPEEAQVLAEELSAAVNVPIIAVLGNHDYESGKQNEVRAILTDARVTVLDGDSCEVMGIGFAGTKGFAGGFGKACLEPWGEAAVKTFVHEAVDETLKLEAALARLSEPTRVALLHYAPIRDTVVGEEPEIFSFLGSRRLEEPLNRFPVDIVLHGHAHYGTPEGRTEKGTPVYNVALPLLAKRFPDSPPFRTLELTVAKPANELNPQTKIGRVTPS